VNLVDILVGVICGGVVVGVLVYLNWDKIRRR